MKPCPTCGREIADTASVCGSCEAWAAALVEAPPADDAARASEPAIPAGDLAAVVATGAAATTAPTTPVPATPVPPTPVPATAGAGSRRRLALIAAGVVIIAMTGFAMAARGKPATGAPVAAAAAAPAARVTPPSATASAPARAPRPPSGTPVQTWSTANQAAWLDNPRRGAAFELFSENIVKTAFGASRPSLVVRCVSKQIEAFVVTGSPMKIDPRVDGKTVTISLDGEPFRTELWTDSNGRTAVFAPNPEAFTARLRAASMLQFGYSPHGAGDVVAQFHVAGIDALIGAASKHCGPAK